MTNIRVNNYDIENCKIDKETKLISISDIHSDIELLDNIHEYLKTILIDLICIQGDVIDYKNDNRNSDILELLKKISYLAKTYISLGNHDICRSRTINIDDYKLDFFKELEKKSECIIFQNDYNSARYNDNININAINFPIKYYIQGENKAILDNIVNKYNGVVDQSKFNILLSHSTNRMINNGVISTDGILKDMDLILGGHNHGCLTPTFIQKMSKRHIGLVGSYSKLFIKDGYGTYSNGNTSIIINDGVTKMSKSCSLGFARNMINKVFIPDIDVITLKKGKTNKLIINSNDIYRK